MTLRTPNTLTSPQVLMDLQRTKERISTLQEQIASGQRIVRLSDDPSGSALVLDFKGSIERNNQYLRQGNAARSFLVASETVLTSVSNNIMRLMELGTQGAATVLTANERAAVATEVDGIRSALLSAANTQEQGKYLFSGTATLTQPFSGPAAGPITYAGNGGLVNLGVSSTSVVATNIPGDTVFFGSGGQGSATDLFQVVTDLRDALLANNLAGVQAANANLQGVHSALLQQIADLGGRQGTLDQLQSTLGDINLSLQSALNSALEVDYPAAITEFTNEQTAQQAALQTMAKVNRQNLFDFLA